MQTSIIKELILKDWRIMRPYILAYWAGGFLSIAIAIVGNETAGLVGMTLFICALAGAGIHAIMATIVEERKEMNQTFIMSLPVTSRDYAVAKMIVNMTIFLSVWATLSAAVYAIFAGGDGLPPGTIPFVTIILVAILLAYVVMLVTAMISESMAWSMVAVVLGNVGTQIYLWVLADLYPIRSTIGGPEAVWGITVGVILTVQVGLAIGLLVLTGLLTFRQRDYV